MNKVISREYVEKNYIHKDKMRKLIQDKAYLDTYNFKTIAVKDIEEFLEETKDETNIECNTENKEK